MDSTPCVLYVGPEGTAVPPALDDASDVHVRTTTADDVATAAAGDVACLLVDDAVADGAVVTVEALPASLDSLPTLVCSARPDGELATAATAVADGYLALSELDERSLTAHLPTPVGDGGTDVVGDSFDAAFETVSESIADGVVTVDTDGRIVYCNDGLADLTGYDRSELVGGPLTRMMPERFRDAHEAGFTRYLRTDERTLDWSSVELAVSRADGEEVPVEVSFGEFERDGDRYFTGTVRDVTERKETERELRAAKELSERVVERIDDGFFALDDEWQFTYVNERAAALLDRDADALVGENVWAEFPAAVGERFETEYRRAMNDQVVVSFEEQFEPLDAWFEVTAYPDDRGLSVFFRDVTERRERERMLSELLETSQRLQRASTKDAVAAVATDAVADTLGFELNAVRLYDPDDETLGVAATTDAVDERLTDRPTYDVGEGHPGRAFAAGETVVREETGDAGFEAALYVPLGEYGTLSIATTDAERLDTTERRIAELLGENVTAAFERAEREQRLAEYELVLENVRGMLYVLDERARLTTVTEPLADRLGYDREGLIGEPVSTFLSDEALAEGRQLIDRLLDADEQSGSFETTLQTRGGESVPVEIELSLLPTEDGYRGSVGAVRDLSTLREARRQLEAQRGRFRNLFEHMPDPVVEVTFDDDATPRLLTANPAFAETFGHDPEAARGESIDELLVPPDDSERAHDLDERVRSGEVVTAELRRRTAGGVRTFLFRGVGFDDPERGTVGLGIYTDVTELRERGRRLEVLQRVLRHNLRTEMTVVEGHLAGLADRLDEDAPELAAATEGIDNVLAISEQVRTVESVLGEADGDPVPATDLVERAVARVRDHHPEATVAADVSVAGVAVDDRLALAVENLLDNAVEHSDRETPHVTVSVGRTDDGRVAVAVADDGPGIPASERDLITGRAEPTQLEHASGLGLWTVRWVTMALSGDLDVEQRSPRGTVVTVTVPAVDLEQ